MHGTIILLFIVMACLGCCRAHPIGCSEDDHCPSGYYCETVQLYCRECLRCEDLKREPPQAAKSCITSVADCGSCFKGLIPDGIENQCMSPEAKKGPLLLPYEWAVITVALLLAILICAVAVYVLRNFYTYKILASTRASVHSPPDSTVVASAPQLPPPYNTVLSLPPPDQCQETWPFIKPTWSPHDDIRETADIQGARVFNNPAYLRTLQPSSDEVPAIDNHESLSTIQEQSINMENSSSGNSIVPDVEGTTANELAVAPVSSEKLLRVRQDSNNNTGEEAGDIGSMPPSFLAHSGTSFIINVIKNVNTVQQRNEVTS